jgi:hypothetical protein
MRFLPLLSALGLLVHLSASAQDPGRHIRQDRVLRDLTVLSSDEMQGRRPLTPGIEKAASYISEAFSKAGLKPLKPGASGHLQRFHTFQSVVKRQSLTIDGRAVADSDYIAFPSVPELRWAGSGAEVVYIPAGGNPLQDVARKVQGDKNLLLVADPSHRRSLERLRRAAFRRLEGAGNVILVYHPGAVGSYAAEVDAEMRRDEYANVVGVVPGRKRPDEMVLFSAHYDHLGIGKPVNRDSIYNGANDDASGTVAVMELARYFKKGRRPERTLVFAAFTAEESGGYGSRYFSKQLDPVKVVAMVNIEMIGTESKWGRNSAFITGYEKSDFGRLMQQSLEGTGFTFHPDPYPAQNLFYRSDNATLAALGVPAHTVSTSKMDSEKFYHTVDDEIGTLDVGNMTAIVRAIALSSRGFVSGRMTPSRVKPD